MHLTIGTMGERVAKIIVDGHHCFTVSTVASSVSLLQRLWQCWGEGSDDEWFVLVKCVMVWEQLVLTLIHLIIYYCVWSVFITIIRQAVTVWYNEQEVGVCRHCLLRHRVWGWHNNMIEHTLIFLCHHFYIFIHIKLEFQNENYLF